MLVNYSQNTLCTLGNR